MTNNSILFNFFFVKVFENRARMNSKILPSPHWRLCGSEDEYGEPGSMREEGSHLAVSIVQYVLIHVQLYISHFKQLLFMFSSYFNLIVRVFYVTN